ncbi:MAG: cytochrome c biogenesis protein CcsA [Alphaproteobacteria bacterium]
MKKIYFFILILLCFMPYPSHGSEGTKINVGAWSSLPILHEGRVKPLDSFARVTLKSFAQTDSLRGLSASEWLALSVFDPATAVYIPAFKIRDAESYGLSKTKNRLYSYTDLGKIIRDNQDNIQKLIQIDEKEWASSQFNLMSHYQHYILYTQILRSLTLILPINEEDHNFLDFKKRQKELDQKTKSIIKNKGTDLEKYTDEEKEIAFLSYQINVIEQSANGNVLFRIIPENWEQKQTNWLSPWDIILSGKGSPKSAEYMKIWQQMAKTYHTDDVEQWSQTIESTKTYFDNPKLRVEKYYNMLNLLHCALIFYIFSFLFIVFSNLANNKKRWRNNLEKISFALLISGAILQSIHIILRIYILERPPVGTLYESILFVSLICVLGFVYAAWKQKSKIGILLGGLSGILLLTTAQGFVSEDSMGTLVAVLNTNFWLGTHVLCITIGYGTCLMASLMAHYDLFMRWQHPEKGEALNQSYQNLKTVVVLSLLFTTVGTILGGIWADQSWGRFWGWDPKENGALLIVLWLAWLLHSRVSQHLTKIGFIVGSAFLSVVVVLAWFGVNLLNVGLHSYGFISGVAFAIASFTIFELALIGGLWGLENKKRTIYEN